MIRPGEKLVGLEKLGITATMTPIEKLELAQPAPVVIHDQLPTWAWWPLIAAILLLVGCYLVYRMLTRDPATARPAMVPGGVTSETAGPNFQHMAGRVHEHATGQYIPSQRFVVLEQVAGKIWGVLNVRYADGMSIPRRLVGERAFRARVRFPNGTEEILYMLQACGNDLRYGGISRYLPGPEFRFEADQPEAPVQTAPVPAPAEPAPTPATVVPVTAPVGHNPVLDQYRTPEGPVPQQVMVPAIPQPVGVITFEFKRSNNGQPNMVRLQGIKAEEFSFSVGPEGTTLRYREVEEEEELVGATK